MRSLSVLALFFLLTVLSDSNTCRIAFYGCIVEAITDKVWPVVSCNYNTTDENI